MKNVLTILVCAILIGIASSCTSMHKIVVAGTPNTLIYTPGGDLIATIDNSGKAKIDLEADAYYAYLLSKSPSSNLLVPFALDYKKNSYTGARVSEGTGIFLMCAGTMAMLTGTIIAIADSEDSTGTELVVGGVGVDLLGASLGVSAGSRCDQLSYKYKFKYLRNQRVNSDMFFEKPVIEYTSVSQSPLQQSDNEDIVSDGRDDINATMVSGRKVSSHSTKTLKDYGSKVEGEYIGSGTLSLGNEVIEKYSNISVVLERITDNTVNVNIIEDGTAFFKYPIVYNIEKNGTGYSLVCKDIKSATIEIDKNNKMKFLHPRINIDGDIYSLSIAASKIKK